MSDKTGPRGEEGERYGNRVYAIRRMLSPDERKDLPLRDFGDLIAAATGRRIHASDLSDIERHARGPRVDDAEAIAAVDPLNRGPVWLIWGGDPMAGRGEPIGQNDATAQQKRASVEPAPSVLFIAKGKATKKRRRGA